MLKSEIILEQFSKILKSYSTKTYDWVDSQTDYLSAWESCEYGDWLLWISENLYSELGSELHRLIVLTACKCARLSIKYIPERNLIPLNAIETTEKWVKGEVNIEEVGRAEEECWKYWNKIWRSNAGVGEAGARYAVSSAGCSCGSARAVRGAGSARLSATAAGYNIGEYNSLKYNKAYSETIKLCADIVRETIPIELIEKLAILKDKEDVIREIIE
jgi:hypothetical protein